MRKTLTVSVIALLLAGSVAWANGGSGPKHDTFSVTLQGDNDMQQGGGTGWSPTGGPGEWIYYDQTDWWNQWFYNDPPDPNRWKEISYDISVDALVTDGFPDVSVEIALNWSTVDFPQTGPGGPPPMPEQEQYIERHVIYSGQGNEPVIGNYTIPDYNPEWVSIDVSVYAWEEIEILGDPDGGPDGGPIGGGPEEFDIVPVDVTIIGDIWHECVPEPATLGLLIIGAAIVLGYRQRAKGANE